MFLKKYNSNKCFIFRGAQILPAHNFLWYFVVIIMGHFIYHSILVLRLANLANNEDRMTE